MTREKLEAELHEKLRQQSVPRTTVHGDLWSGNILVAGGKVTGVVDWECGRVSGEPVRDLVRFALMYALYLDRRTKPGRRVVGHPGLRAGEWGAFDLVHARFVLEHVSDPLAVVEVLSPSTIDIDCRPMLCTRRMSSATQPSVRPGSAFGPVRRSTAAARSIVSAGDRE